MRLQQEWASGPAGRTGFSLTDLLPSHDFLLHQAELGGQVLHVGLMMRTAKGAGCLAGRQEGVLRRRDLPRVGKREQASQAWAPGGGW